MAQKQANQAIVSFFAFGHCLRSPFRPQLLHTLGWCGSAAGATAFIYFTSSKDRQTG